jgi:hypothetical protein
MEDANARAEGPACRVDVGMVEQVPYTRCEN